MPLVSHGICAQDRNLRCETMLHRKTEQIHPPNVVWSDIFFNLIIAIEQKNQNKHA